MWKRIFWMWQMWVGMNRNWDSNYTSNNNTVHAHRHNTKWSHHFCCTRHMMFVCVRWCEFIFYLFFLSIPLTFPRPFALLFRRKCTNGTTYHISTIFVSVKGDACVVCPSPERSLHIQQSNARERSIDRTGPVQIDRSSSVCVCICMGVCASRGNGRNFLLLSFSFSHFHRTRIIFFL